MVETKLIKKRSYINWKYGENEKYNPIIFCELYIQKSWDNMFELSNNPNITLEFILSHLGKRWYWEDVSRNPNITLQDILKHSELPWNWNGITRNPNITLQDILKHPELPWNFSYISVNPNITIKDILEHPEINWNWSDVSMNANITFRDILTHPELPLIVDYMEDNHNLNNLKYASYFSYDKKNLVKEFFSQNPNITLKLILEHPEISWRWLTISKNPNITMSDILSHPLKSWDWKNVAKNPNIKLSEIFEHLDDPSGLINEISRNPSITIKDILRYPKMKWRCCENKFLWNDFVFKKNLKSDIQKRRKAIKELSLFGSLETLVNKYV